MDQFNRIAVVSRSFGKSSQAPLDYLLERGYDVRVRRSVNLHDPAEIASLIGEADCAIVGNDTIDAYVMDRCPNLKVVSKMGVGLDAIDLKEAEKRGIRVMYTPAANNESVADLAVLLILGCLRHLREYMMTRPTPDWSVRAMGNELGGKTVGIVGFGRIGHAVAKRLTGFDVSMLAYDAYLPEDAELPAGVRRCGFDELLAGSDIVTIHAPLTGETAGMFCRETFEKMKPGSILINTARGGLVRTEDLRDALKSGHIRAAGLDVFEEEPVKDEEMLQWESVLATPHIAAHTTEANIRMGMECAVNADRALCALRGEGIL